MRGTGGLCAGGEGDEGLGGGWSQHGHLSAAAGHVEALLLHRLSGEGQKEEEQEEGEDHHGHCAVAHHHLLGHASLSFFQPGHWHYFCSCGAWPVRRGKLYPGGVTPFSTFLEP